MNACYFQNNRVFYLVENETGCAIYSDSPVQLEINNSFFTVNNSLYILLN